MRSLTSVKAILLDEADFFPPGQQQDARDVSERYIGKSDPYIVMVSTPNQPNGLFQRIEQEPAGTCLYKRLFLDYTYGLDKIYSREDIDTAMQSPSWEREYCLKYLGGIGDVFSQKMIDLTAIFGYIKSFCPRCGKGVITECPNSSCKDPIRERYSSEDIEIGISYTPSYCSECRKPATAGQTQN